MGRSIVIRLIESHLIGLAEFSDRFLELVYSLSQLGKALKHRRRLLGTHEFKGRRTKHRFSLGNTLSHSGLGPNDGPRANLYVSDETGLGSQGRIVSDLRGAGNPGLSDKETMTPDLTVVADHDQIVDFGSTTDSSAIEGSPVNGRIGADFDVVI